MEEAGEEGEDDAFVGGDGGKGEGGEGGANVGGTGGKASIRKSRESKVHFDGGEQCSDQGQVSIQ